ncbi:sensor histidine kinase [Cohnella zeiphila]|uniref:histidine kinase n=1 Tax=Cohnella zeiphila TaxID=2761120 RepID=A0A7X0ST31_9BACL|nr:HAMP domain-containing sensor histidine kinase [Cohnella zeiphila]MBB6733383.1 HAMP domain-containing histidine kinase [Cohnella zeiphila]
MTIRKKLILSHIAMIVIPVLLAALTETVFFRAVFQPSGGISPPSHFETAGGGNDWASGFFYAIERDPGLLADEKFRSDAEERLEQMSMAMAIEQSGRLVYAAPRLGNSVDLSELNEKAGGGDREEWGPAYFRHSVKIGGASYKVERHEIAAAGDSPKQTVYVLTDLGATTRFFRTFVPVLFLSLLLGIALTNGLLSYFLSRGIVRPLQELKRAAERIKEGDLDQGLGVGRKDEIGQAIGAFEEMRLRLRESLATQLQYEENRRELLSNVSHDLRTPIAAISACVEGLQSGIADSKEKQLQYVGMIQRKITDMSRMIEELFLFSKLDLQRLPFDFETVDLAAYLGELAEELRHDPRLADVELSLHADERPTVLAAVDREKLGRALANVIDNSLKHMDKTEKKLAIELIRREPGAATILVRDNGRGIGAEKLPHVFERFYRADPSRGSDAGGSGLGLAIVRQIMEAHGGKAEAESVEGAGTTLALTLPLAVPKKREAGENRKEGGGTNGGTDSDH